MILCTIESALDIGAIPRRQVIAARLQALA
jgi:hypothetical protein